MQTKSDLLNAKLNNEQNCLQSFKKEFLPAIFYATIPSEINDFIVFSKLRQNEIDKCTDIKTKAQKYCVWKLLEIAVNKHIGIDFNKIQFKKNQNGKWECDEFCFSLTHSNSLVAVAISPYFIGVDAQILKAVNPDLQNKILTESEQKFYNTLSDEDKQLFLITSWCKKESLLKLNGDKALLPTKREAQTVEFFNKDILIADEKYFICACGKGVDKNISITQIKL